MFDRLCAQTGGKETPKSKPLPTYTVTPDEAVSSICPLDYGATNIAKQSELLLNIYATVLAVLKNDFH